MENQETGRDALRMLIMDSLRDQGFQVLDGRILPPLHVNKDHLRNSHFNAVAHRVEKSRNGLIRHEDHLLKRVASGRQVDPTKMTPRLIEVKPGSEDELLFRYARLHWSIPVSPGYGRRLRFLVVDEHNEKLVGIVGLGDPVMNLGARDQWVGWKPDQRRERLRHVMDAFVLGAVPPYSMLLGGKLIAMLATSDEVRAAFCRKYRCRTSLISRRQSSGELAMLTTVSALGKSSLYNRVRFHHRLIYHSVGFTRGYGELCFIDGLYEPIWQYVRNNASATAKHERWGKGFRNRREVIKKCLQSLGLSSEWLYHGVKREVFVMPLAQNTKQFLCGSDDELQYFRQPAEDLFEYFRDRWLLPRALRDERYRFFEPEEYRIWRKG